MALIPRVPVGTGGPRLDADLSCVFMKSHDFWAPF